MTQKESWQSLLTTALVGTDRQAFDPGTLDGPLSEAIARISHSDAAPSSALLASAAALSGYRRAGAMPPAVQLPAFEPSPQEARGTSSPLAESFLRVILGGDYQEVLPEYLDLVDKAGKRVSEIYLPSLLDLGRRRSEIRPALLAAGGERLRWLASLNDAWNYANIGQTTETEEERTAAWETGTRTGRVSILQCLRREDPQRGRELLEMTWKQEVAVDRAAFVGALEYGLSLDDEVFLDAALADRSVEVGRAAADMLSRLPRSLYSRRMAQRARRAISLVKTADGWSLRVTLPEKLDDDLKADRVEERSTNRLLGERAWLLCQILGYAPLSIWQGPELPPIAEAIGLAERNDWSNAIITGWSIALKRHPDPLWLMELTRHWLRTAERSAQVLEYLPPLELFPDTAKSLILEFLGAEGEAPLHDKHPAFYLLSVYRSPWSDVLSRGVVNSLAARLGQAGAAGASLYQLQSAIPSFALRMPSSLAQEVTAALDPLTGKIAGWRGALEKLMQTLQFRHDMTAAIRG